MELCSQDEKCKIEIKKELKDELEVIKIDRGCSGNRFPVSQFTSGLISYSKTTSVCNFNNSEDCDDDLTLLACNLNSTATPAGRCYLNPTGLSDDVCYKCSEILYTGNNQSDNPNYASCRLASPLPGINYDKCSGQCQTKEEIYSLYSGMNSNEPEYTETWFTRGCQDYNDMERKWNSSFVTCDDAICQFESEMNIFNQNCFNVSSTTVISGTTSVAMTTLQPKETPLTAEIITIISLIGMIFILIIILLIIICRKIK